MRCAAPPAVRLVFPLLLPPSLSSVSSCVYVVVSDSRASSSSIHIVCTPLLPSPLCSSRSSLRVSFVNINVHTYNARHTHTSIHPTIDTSRIDIPLPLSPSSVSADRLVVSLPLPLIHLISHVCITRCYIHTYCLSLRRSPFGIISYRLLRSSII